MFGQETYLYVHRDLIEDEPEPVPVGRMRRGNEYNLVKIRYDPGGCPSTDFHYEPGNGLQSHGAIVSRWGVGDTGQVQVLHKAIEASSQACLHAALSCRIDIEWVVIEKQDSVGVNGEVL